MKGYYTGVNKTRSSVYRRIYTIDVNNADRTWRVLRVFGGMAVEFETLEGVEKRAMVPQNWVIA